MTWTYSVTTTGNVWLSGISVTDTVSGVNPTPVDANVDTYNDGDTNKDNILQPGEIWLYRATGTATAGQYSNIGTTTGNPVYNNGTTPVPGLTPPTDTDPSHYFGVQSGITVVKKVNGDDANSPTGPVVAVGAPLTFTYAVNNTGNAEISSVTLSDNVLGSITSYTGDTDNDGKLDPSETWTYTKTATATAGQVTNIGTVSGTDAANKPVSDTDPANYFGVQSGITVVKKVNGDDANSPTGPVVAVGGPLTFTYAVNNTGNAEISSVTLSDNVLGSITSYTGDTDNDGKLDPSETWTYTKTATATAGQVTNIGTVSGTDAANKPVSDTDPANYFGVQSGITVVKKVNGDDANSPTGPVVAVGAPLTFTYAVNNTGNAEISSVTLSDNVLGSITSYTGDTDNDGKLDPSETWTYTKTATATAGQVTNIGTVSGTDAANKPVSDTDPANYFGVQSGITVVKKVNGDDANSPTGPVVAVGAPLTFTYAVNNTGNAEISSVTLSDNVLGSITSYTGDTDNDGKLDPSETWTYTKTATATAGQVTNIGTVSGTDAANKPVSDTDPANYFGVQSGITVVKKVNGDDANSPTGPVVAVGAPLTFTYAVNNTGNAEISSVTLSDNVLGSITELHGRHGQRRQAGPQRDLDLHQDGDGDGGSSDQYRHGEWHGCGQQAGQRHRPGELLWGPGRHRHREVRRRAGCRQRNRPVPERGRHCHLHLRGQEHGQRGAGWRERQRRQTRRHHRLHRR